MKTLRATLLQAKVFWTRFGAIRNRDWLVAEYVQRFFVGSSPTALTNLLCGRVEKSADAELRHRSGSEG